MQIDEGTLNATISDSPPVITFSDDIPLPTRAELESLLLSISTINKKIKAFDREVGLSKLYQSKIGKPGQGRLSPVDGEEPKWSFVTPTEGEHGKKSKGKSGVVARGGGVKFADNTPMDKMEE